MNIDTIKNLKRATIILFLTLILIQLFIPISAYADDGEIIIDNDWNVFIGKYENIIILSSGVGAIVMAISFVFQLARMFLLAIIQILNLDNLADERECGEGNNDEGNQETEGLIQRKKHWKLLASELFIIIVVGTILSVVALKMSGII